MCLCMFWGQQFDDTFENTQWRKVKQMQPMWLCLLWSKIFKSTFENTQWRKVKQMQPVWLCFFLMTSIWGVIWKHTVEKVKQMQPVLLFLFPWKKQMQSNENTQLIKVEQQRLRIHLKKKREISKHLTGRFPQKAFEGSYLVAIAHFFKHCSGGVGLGSKAVWTMLKKCTIGTRWLPKPVSRGLSSQRGRRMKSTLGPWFSERHGQEYWDNTTG